LGRCRRDPAALGAALSLRRVVYADSSALVGLVAPGESLQRVCEAVLRDLVERYQVQILTTKWVQYESLTTLRSHGISYFRRLQRLLEGELFSVEPVSAELEDRTVEIFWTHHDKDWSNWSIVDCSGIALMEHRQIRYAFAADHHFRQAGRIPLLEQTADGRWQKSYSYLNFGW